ncbi:hypothetical protein QTJ16_004700 [Diplocarpon rosae]|uniref:Peroxisomal membrane protein PEX14 n=1 Tax=Diplocarpon rosae TaxID=946125 RepID=A0AAD9SVK0_9HELO|nr:hypothetical protein QTJ16_004700 [Diplocarpon rosae]PBP18823.1 peroxisomal membrane anchor protein [Diplocarpon rosae]
MSDSNPAKKDSAQSGLQTPDPESAQDNPALARIESRETLISQARKFLKEDDIRDASTDKKIAFLQSKGLQDEEIQRLLGVTRNSESSTRSPEVAYRNPIIKSWTNTTQSLELPPLHPQNTPPPPSQHMLQSLSQPPIITYPEFLTTPPYPTPLITKPRLLTIFYLFSGLTALLYGTHEYLLTPMLASLTSARLSLAFTSKSNLQKLITTLKTLVSELPPEARNKQVTESIETPSAESDTDPTELFHRDIGIQTSPLHTRPSSPTLLQTHVARLSTLKSSLKEIAANDSAERYKISEVEGEMERLREYLNEIAYVAPSYGYALPGGWNSRKEDDDEIARLKKEIRGVKGVLLSTRSFPGGGGMRTSAWH